ncbi:DNA/RNA nuclease SfsA [Halobacteriovorax sp. XZX-3]|uniref:DNA/RNA nuclease SfsA n=1 Tax=unclassified Halobacteriovorax TaxID=2639665 RepID=UPI001304CE94|nr:DNA/RNA nuclease SfsA [Halobacteriovorax sp. DA5]
MQFKENELVLGTIIERYKRFLLDFKLDNAFKEYSCEQTLTAHLANTGSMKTCWEPDWKVLMTHSDDPKRKLKFSAQMISNGDSWIMVNTGLTNKIVQEGLELGKFEELRGYDFFKSEVKIGKSRIDFLLSNKEIDKKDLKLEDPSFKYNFVEVKNVTLKVGDQAQFPDAVSTRGQKHLEELMAIKEQGHEATMLYIVSREDVKSFNVSDIDTEYKRLLIKAKEAGVQILAYQLNMNEKEITVAKKLKIVL